MYWRKQKSQTKGAEKKAVKDGKSWKQFNLQLVASWKVYNWRKLSGWNPATRQGSRRSVYHLILKGHHHLGAKPSCWITTQKWLSSLESMLQRASLWVDLEMISFLLQRRKYFPSRPAVTHYHTFQCMLIMQRLECWTRKNEFSTLL